MLNLVDPIVKFKLELLDTVLPTESVGVFGDIYIIDGGYSEYAANNGADRVVLVDSLETTDWQRSRLANPRLDYYKGDFSDPFFMASIRETFNVSVAFEVMLHQAPLLQALHDMLARTTEYFVFAQPTLTERREANSLVYLPGYPGSNMHPLNIDDAEYRMFDAEAVNQSNWIWGLTPSFVTSALKGEGFEITEARTLASMPNPEWMWWGCVARRKNETDPRHWSNFRRTPGLPTAPWGTSTTPYVDTDGLL